MRVTAILAISMVTVGCAHAGLTATSSPTPQTSTSAALDHTQQIENWRHNHRSAFTTLGKAMYDLGDAMVAKAPDWNVIHADCAKLSDATPAMSDALPSPDERLNAALKDMLDNINVAMIECPSLNANSDRIDANLFLTNLQRALDRLSVVKQIMG